MLLRSSQSSFTLSMNEVPTCNTSGSSLVAVGILKKKFALSVPSKVCVLAT